MGVADGGVAVAPSWQPARQARLATTMTSHRIGVGCMERAPYHRGRLKQPGRAPALDSRARVVGFEPCTSTP